MHNCLGLEAKCDTIDGKSKVKMASPKEATIALSNTATAVYAVSPSGGVVSVAQEDAVRSDIPIRITLGDATLTMGSNGQWEIENSPLGGYVEQVKTLSERAERLEKENAQLKERCSRLTEESNMEKFKCQLLVEMLALSSLDEERSRGEAEMERVKVTSMKNDLQSLMNEARSQGVDVRKLAGVLSVP